MYVCIYTHIHTHIYAHTHICMHTFTERKRIQLTKSVLLSQLLVGSQRENGEKYMIMKKTAANHHLFAIQLIMSLLCPKHCLKFP